MGKKKSHPFNVLSDVECATLGCTKKLKLRLVEEKPTVRFCFRCSIRRKKKHARRYAS